MLFPLTVSGVALFYLGAIPICFAVSLRWDGAPAFGAGLALFEPRFALRRAKQVSAPKLRVSQSNPRDLPRWFCAAFCASKSLFAHLPSNGATLCGTLGTSDAALTATICGSVNALGGALNAATNGRVALSLHPNFSTNQLCVEASGMISARAGHIILAAFFGALEYETGRFRSWISTPLKGL